MGLIDFDLAPETGSGSVLEKSEVSVHTPESELPDFLLRLNEKQREAAILTEGPLIVLAGAGSGKTSMITARIAYLIGGLGIPPYQILAMTFTNKAAKEMKERIHRILHSISDQANGSQIGSPEIGTFHSVCVKILRREMDKTPFSKPFVIYDDSDQLTLIKNILKRLNIDPKKISPKALQGMINLSKCHAEEPHQVEVSPLDPMTKIFKQVYTIYQKDLFANNAVDFGEIITMTYRLLRDHEDVRKKYQRRFRYVHVDEYQDTNQAQYLLLAQLTQSKFGGHENICVVGDEDQSIYKWRGADIQNILGFEEDFPKAMMVKLEQNYRSTKKIISAASEVISHNLQRKKKELWTDNPDGFPIYRIQVLDERAEANVVVAEMKRLALEEAKSYDEFAIFYRTHAQSRQFEDVLRREKIAYQIIGGLRFYDRKEIKDVLSYLKLIQNPNDSVSLLRIINVPVRGIGKTTIDKLLSMSHEEQEGGLGIQEERSLWSVIQSVVSAGTAPGINKRAVSKLSEFYRIIEQLQQKQPQMLLSELYHQILELTGYVRALKQEATIEAETRIENLEEFDTMIQEFEEEFFEAVKEQEGSDDKTKLLSVFIEQTSLLTDTDKNFDPSSIKLMTYHAAKGLEYPVVFMVGMEEGLFPSQRPWEETDEEEIEEERRLCYVGMTRAKEKLFLSNVVMRRLWGQVHYHEPARFLNEIPEEMVEVRDYTAQGGSRPAADQRPTRQTQYYDDSSDLVYANGTSQNELVGRKISHPQYGMGTILSIEGINDNQKAVIEFGGQSRRKFLLRFLEGYLGSN